MSKKSTNKILVDACMPPLLPQETVPLVDSNFSGRSCENLIKTYFLSKGFNIATFEVDDGIDVLIPLENKNRQMIWGQVKKVVYHNELDLKMKSKKGIDVYRSRFKFNFQTSKENKQKKLNDIDYFYHVLFTSCRQLIWETPATLVPLRENGEFIESTTSVLDRPKFLTTDMNFGDRLVYSRYDPIVFKTHPNFFLKKEQVTIDNFLL